MSDILVIGGGIAGISAAARLSKHAQVTVLEAENSLGYHASGRSAALFEENYGCPSVKVLNRASAQYHRSANGGYLSPRGLLILCREGEDAGFEKDLKDMNTNEISPNEARSIVPIINDKITRAGYHEAAYDLDTDRMIQDFAKTLRSNAGQVITNSKVDKINYVNKRWTVHCGDKVYSAEILVNAAGAWADEIATLSNIKTIGLKPLRRSIAQTPAPDGYDVTNWPIFFGVGEAWYCKPDAGKLLISPADEALVEPHDAFADDMTLAEGIDRFHQHVTHEVTRVQTTWAGLRTFAPDRTRVLGRDAANPAFVWCAGQGGYGFQTAPAASQLIADLITGQAAEIDEETTSALSPHRFGI
jgi:glycine/D-amino acid oxidase-like deaminating enzyme